MYSRVKNRARAGMVAGLGAVLVLAMVIPMAAGGKTPGASGALNKAFAAEAAPGGGVADRQLLGLFSESVTGNFKKKVASTQWGQVRNTRLFCQWYAIQPKSKNSYDWSKMDQEVNSALSLGVNSVLLTISPPVPDWAQNASSPYPQWMASPKRVDDWGDFCGAVAERYKGYVDYYQIWHEPGWDSNAPPAANDVIYYSGECEYGYLGLLRSAYQKIKKVNPQAYVISGSLLQGLTRSGDNFTQYETLLKGANQDVSMKIDANMNIVAERPMYFNYHGSWTGGTVELGVKKPRTTWARTRVTRLT
jgi:hypothetical protein